MKIKFPKIKIQMISKIKLNIIKYFSYIKHHNVAHIEIDVGNEFMFCIIS